ncbi:NrfD/PsrC family molybdoenzyme membrane anchor subunit [Desulfosediminicola ganghwensis]|uniref:NrfD/PsrC family molybdoenzyme membrane anchor subunit n=1 Tax=Desulfosediminicola ganghwensis TaxID=2569540 RepID=UPI0010AB9FBD|nr:NrfD/PsrC family molybdoenzyme membrane anchor subunit [Desulfosediminicola ganghwensis]
MNSVWGSVAQYDPVVWNWVIAVYLFLAGLSAGCLLIGIGLKWYNGTSGNLRPDGTISEPPVLKAAAFIAPLTITVGLACLVLDLTKPLNFWVILVKYNLSSVMSLGVIALLIYTPVAFLYAILVLQDSPVPRYPLLGKIAVIVETIRGPFEVFLFLMAIIVAAYTGFLLSAMNAYPMLNTAILPALFLVSALSAGAAANNLLAIAMFKGKADEREMQQTHSFEGVVIFLEVMFLFMLFMALYFAGGAAAEAVGALRNGFWARTFWICVVAIGFGIPLLTMTLPKALKHSRGIVIIAACSSLVGVLALRHFILYAGQSYIS